MTVFDDLRTLFVAWRERHRKYFMESLQFIFRFTAAFGKYIDAPETYKEILSLEDDPRKAPTRQYVELVQAVKDDEGKMHFNKLPFSTDALKPDGDGCWISYIGVTIDIAPDAHPKTEFTFPVRFTLCPDQSKVQIGEKGEGQEFEIAANNPKTFEPAYKYMINLLREVLDSQPWGVSKKLQVGFSPLQEETLDLDQIDA